MQRMRDKFVSKCSIFTILTNYFAQYEISHHSGDLTEAQHNRNVHIDTNKIFAASDPIIQNFATCNHLDPSLLYMSQHLSDIRWKEKKEDFAASDHLFHLFIFPTQWTNIMKKIKTYSSTLAGF